MQTNLSHDLVRDNLSADASEISLIHATRVAWKHHVVVVERWSRGRCVVPLRNGVIGVELGNRRIAVEPEFHTGKRATVVAYAHVRVATQQTHSIRHIK